MPPWAELQRDLAQALLDPALPVPGGLVGPDGSPSARRFAVYRNNVVIGLAATLATSFPAVCRIVGDEFFQTMAAAFARATPPSSPILLDYGAGFADFIAACPPASSLPYLPDVARIERAWREAYHAAEAAALFAEDLAEIPGERAAALRLALHPSLRLVRSRFPALTIWRMNVADGVPAPVDLEAGGEDALILRPAADVTVLSLPPGAAELVTALARGESLGEAAACALDAAPAFDLAGALAALIAAGAFVAYDLDEEGGAS